MFDDYDDYDDYEDLPTYNSKIASEIRRIQCEWALNEELYGPACFLEETVPGPTKGNV